MREYIVYTILVFFPIGILMSYLLRRQGLILKYRLAIITASLAIIISFPIFMGNLGLPTALLLYFSAILALTWFLIKAIQTPAWYLSRGASSTDEVYASKRLIDMTKVQTVGDFEDAVWFEESEGSNLPADESWLSADAETNANSSGNNEIILNSDNFLESLDQTVEVDSVPGQKSAVKAQDDAINDQTLILDNDTAELSTLSVHMEESADEEPIIEEAYKTDNLEEVEPDHVSKINADMPIEVDNSSKSSAENFAASEQFHEAKDLERLEGEPLKTALNEPAAQETAAIMADDGDGLSTSTYINNTDTEDDILPILSDSLQTTDPGAKVPVDSEPNQSDEPLVKIQGRDNIMETSEAVGDNDLSREDDRVNQLIDQAFVLKNAQHIDQALDCLAQALKITSDEDLYYLLLMEMVNIYKDMGMYTQAEELLFASIGKAYRRTDIIDAIKRQLSYIRMLSFELDRLGLANTPISEVPRLVRKNLAEFVEI